MITDSFLHVPKEYNKRKLSYLKSYKQFTLMKNIAPYLLLPITIKPDGMFLKCWSIIRICIALILSLLIPVSFTSIYKALYKRKYTLVFIYTRISV